MDKILYKAQKKYLDSLLLEDEPLLQEMESFAKENKIPILDKHAAQFLEQMILLNKPSRVLEIGMAIAYSTIRVARNLKNKGAVHAIEKSNDNIKLAKNYISKSGLGKKINIIEGDALQLMPKMEEKFDFIFLDADKEDYEKLFYYSLILLKKNGVIFIDNLLWHGFTAASKVPDGYKRSTEYIRKFNKFFISQRALKTSILPIGDGIGLGIKVD